MSNQLSHEYRKLRKIWLASIPEDARACAYCKKAVWSSVWGQWTGDWRRFATIDHKVPRSNGGEETDTANFVLCCNRCNANKAATSKHEFLEARA